MPKKKESGVLTDKQRRFADEYLVDCNATKAAIRAGYSQSKSGSCNYSSKLLANPDVRAYINGELEKIHNKNIANVEEVLKFLTHVMRGETKEQVILRAGGDQQLTMVEVSARERLKAAELIGKRYGMFSENVASQGDNDPVIICGEEEVGKM